MTFTIRPWLKSLLWHSVQCSRCQLGCSTSQNFPCISGNSYRSILSEIDFENHKKQYFSWLLRSQHIKTNNLEIAWQNWPFKIGLSLLHFKQLLVDSGSIVQCTGLITYKYCLVIISMSGQVSSSTASPLTGGQARVENKCLYSFCRDTFCSIPALSISPKPVSHQTG